MSTNGRESSRRRVAPPGTSDTRACSSRSPSQDLPLERAVLPSLHEYPIRGVPRVESCARPESSMAPKSMLKAVFFDIDDTLYSTHSFAMRARAASVDAMLAMGLKADRRTVLRELT